MQVEHGAISPMQTIPSMLAMIDVGAKLGTSSSLSTVKTVVDNGSNNPI
jgi:hypothetical protein